LANGYSDRLCQTQIPCLNLLSCCLRGSTSELLPFRAAAVTPSRTLAAPSPHSSQRESGCARHLGEYIISGLAAHHLDTFRVQRRRRLLTHQPTQQSGNSFVESLLRISGFGVRGRPPNSETRNPKHETRDPKIETRNTKHENRKPRSRRTPWARACSRAASRSRPADWRVVMTGFYF